MVRCGKDVELKEVLAWAIFEDGMINLNTVHGRAPCSAMVNWLCTNRNMLLTKNWPDKEIERKFKKEVAKSGSNAKVVRVKIEVVDG